MTFKRFIIAALIFLQNATTAALILDAPDNPFVTFEDTVVIRGSVSPNVMLFSQETPVYIRNDNVFEFEHKLPTGDSTVWLSIIKNDGSKESHAINIRRLIIPQIVLETPKLNPYTILMNTNFIHPKTILRQGNEKITREEFKFFTDKIAEKINTDNKQEHDHLKNYMDGEFYPEAAMTELDYIIAILSLYNIPFNEDAIKTPWIENLVKTAQNKNLFSYNQSINSTANLTVKKFYDWALEVPAIKLAEKELYQVSTENNGANLSEIHDKIDKILDTLQANRVGAFTLEAPQEFEIIIDTKVTFIGIASPNSTITINSIAIQSDFNGNFQHTQDLVIGKNDFILTNVNGLIESSIYSYDGFEDLKFHPFRKEAAELKYYGLIENTQQFLPSKQLTPSEAIKIATPFIQVISTQNISQPSEEEIIQALAKWNLNPLSSKLEKLDWVEKLTRQDDIINYIERVKLNAEEEFRDTI